MAIFDSYVILPEGIKNWKTPMKSPWTTETDRKKKKQKVVWFTIKWSTEIAFDVHELLKQITIKWSINIHENEWKQGDLGCRLRSPWPDAGIHPKPWQPYIPVIYQFPWVMAILKWEWECKLGNYDIYDPWTLSNDVKWHPIWQSRELPHCSGWWRGMSMDHVIILN